MTDPHSSDPAEAAAVSRRLAEIARRVGATVAGPQAYDVDLQARFPSEAIEALRAEGVLSALVPVELGGMGASLTDMSDLIRVISRYCASTGTVLAMHSVDIFLLVNYGSTPALRRLAGQIADQQLLVANGVSEVEPGLAALVPEGDGWHIDRRMAACSYGLHADLITTTARRSPEAPPSDQVLALIPEANLTREATGEWNTLGLRGTCSSGLHIEGRVTSEDLFPVPFADIAFTGGQVIHVLTNAVWTGLAEAALHEAHTRVRAVSRKQIDTVPQVAIRLAEMLAGVEAARSTLATALVRFEAAVTADALDDRLLLASLRNVKLITTTTAVQTATSALQVCGISGFRRGEQHHLERIIRDSLGGLVMVGNDRFLAENAQLLRLMKSI